MRIRKQKIKEDFEDIENMPDSPADKIIKDQGYASFRGTRYYKRVFSDGSAELIRYDFGIGKWIVLCFTA